MVTGFSGLMQLPPPKEIIPPMAHVHFVLGETMGVPRRRSRQGRLMESELSADDPVLRIAAAIGEPARARMLYSLMDKRARTGTELALAANVSPPTASVHLSRLKAEGLVRVQAQGKHRYYT